MMDSDIERVLISREAIARRVEEVARQITGDFNNHTSGQVSGAGAGGTCESPEITLVPILTGSIIFVADLIRRLPIRMQIRLVSVSSYRGAVTRAKQALIREELTMLPQSLTGEHVLVIDDILDSGQTLAMVQRLLRQKNPASLRTCVLLRKRRPEAMNFSVDYVCFDVPDEFVVGYGLDYNDYYRNLPDIVTLRPQVIHAHAPAGPEIQP